MSQQFRIESEQLRDKINSLLPSQARGGIGVDLSGSTTIIPVVDLTETAEGSSLRQDLQTAVSLATTNTEINGATTTILNTTGFFKVSATLGNRSGGSQDATFIINDGTTDKTIKLVRDAVSKTVVIPDFVIFLTSGDSFKVTSTNANFFINVQTHQIADIKGNLINPQGFA